MKFPFAGLYFRWAAVLCLWAVTARADDPSSWLFAAEGLAPDPGWVWGRLPNGLRYAVRQNALPAGHVSYRLAVEVGGAHETKDEHGYAHFVEHMAFSGTRHHPGETLYRDMEKRGVALGPEVSAFTFLSHTIYLIDLPSNRTDDIDWTLQVLRDFTDGIQFEKPQVQRELGVILAEIRDRDNVSGRYDQSRRTAIYPMSSLSNSVSGTPQTATPEKLRAFYQKWYRPERMILIVAGDAAPDVLVAAIHRQFDSLPAAVTPPPAFDPGYLENPPRGTTTLIHDPNSSGLLLEVVSVRPVAAADSVAERRRNLAASLATTIVSERLQELARENPKVHGSSWARVLAPTPYADEASVVLQGPSNEWGRNTADLESELRRSFEFTFFPSEIAEAQRRVLAIFEQYAKASASAKSADLATAVMQEAVWHRVTLAPAAALAQAQAILPKLDSRSINDAWRSYWQPGRASLVAFGYFPVRNGGQLVSQVFADSSRRPLPPPRPPVRAAFAYTDFGPAMAPVRRTYEAAVDMHLLTFPNGIRVNLKHTDSEANTVYLSSRLGTGLQSQPPQLAGLGPLASLCLVESGLGKLPPEQLRHLLAAEPVSLQFGANEGEFAFSGSAATQRLELLLRLLCAYLTDPAWDAKAFESATLRLISQRNDMEHTSEGALGLNVFLTATGQDRRYTVVNNQDLAKIDVATLRSWLEPQLRAAPLEIGLVGDFPVEETIALLGRTLGALPARTGAPVADYPVRFSKQPGEFYVEMFHPCPRAGLEILWPADMGRDVHLSRRLEVLGTILNNRVFQRIREDLGAAYSPSAEYWKSETTGEEGYLTASVTTAPDQLAKVSKLVREAADQLARQGATPAEFADAIVPLRARCQTQLKENSYWLWHISNCAQSKPDALTWPLTRSVDFEKVTVGEINDLAREVLPRTKALTFFARPPSR